jgi:hypothetical protein
VGRPPIRPLLPSVRRHRWSKSACGLQAHRVSVQRDILLEARENRGVRPIRRSSGLVSGCLQTMMMPCPTPAAGASRSPSMAIQYLA